jgi:lysophospholipase L1-like esterase
MSSRTRRVFAVSLVVIAMCVPAFAHAKTRVAIEPYGGPNGNGQHTLLVIGDSLTDGARAFGQLERRLRRLPIWTDVIVDAKWGRRGPEGISALRTHLQKNPNITAVIFALGTNDLLSRRQASYPRWLITEYNKEFAHIPTLWIDAQYRANHPDWNMRARRFSRVLANVSAAANNTHHASWFKHFSRTSPWYQFDGVHLSPRGYRMRADFIVREARRFGHTTVAATTTVPTTTTTPTTSTTTTLPDETPDDTGPDISPP